METLLAIQTRRSVRKFLKNEVPDEVITEALKAAMMAPSANNAQPWEFMVIKNKSTLKEMSKIHDHAVIVKDAPAAIVVLGNTQKEQIQEYWCHDLSAATQNILLALHDMGLGAVWCGIYPNMERTQNFMQLLGSPEHVYPFALIPIGYPNQEFSAQDRFDPSRIHYEKY